MSADEILDYLQLVRQMRRRQREYFSTRSPTVLRIAKDLERRVD